MELTSLQVCMDSPDWLQGTIQEETGMDSSSPISGDMLTCSRPLIERRLRPPHDQALKCPRCDSTHTKFCYYNNYSLSQPRYFCKTCRRYWTKGGTLRNVPVGGGCKKNKKVASSKKSSNNNNDQFLNNNKNINLGGSTSSSSNFNQGDHLQLSFPHEVQFSHIANLLGNHFGGFGNHNFMETKYNNNIPILENPTHQIDFMDNNKYDALNGDLAIIGGISDMTNSNNLMEVPSNFHNFCTTPFGMSSIDGNQGGIMDINCQRLMLPYDQYSSHDLDHQNALDVKPNAKLLSMEWHDQGCSDGGKEPYGYFNGVGSWPGLMNGYGSSTTSHLV